MGNLNLFKVETIIPHHNPYTSGPTTVLDTHPTFQQVENTLRHPLSTLREITIDHSYFDGIENWVVEVSIF